MNVAVRAHAPRPTEQLMPTGNPSSMVPSQSLSLPSHTSSPVGVQRYASMGGGASIAGASIATGASIAGASIGGGASTCSSLPRAHAAMASSPKTFHARTSRSYGSLRRIYKA